jgi:uncharacterized membrane protein
MAHRRREVSRIEGFSDAVFAFAITLLVVSLEVPKTFHELTLTIEGFPAFAVAFALLFQIWWRHYRFFRSYDLEDSYVIAVTGVLLFVVLFFVYPMKFLWALPFASLQGREVTEQVITLAEVPLLFVVYGAGVVAVFSLLALLYHHAYTRRDVLALTPAEILEVRVDVYRNVAIAIWGVASILVAVITGRLAPRLVGLAGYLYTGIGLSEWSLGEYRRRQLAKVAATRTAG